MSVAPALAAERASQVRLSPATSNPITRHPVVLATPVASLGELALGRALLTLGVGYLGVRSIGRRRATVDQMRHAITSIRDLVTGREVAWNGTVTRLRSTSSPPPPVNLLTSGPKMVALAGETTDRAVLMVGIDRRSVAAAREHLCAGSRAVWPLGEGLPSRLHPADYAGPTQSGAPMAPNLVGSNESWLNVPRHWNRYRLAQAGIGLAKIGQPTDISDEKPIGSAMRSAFSPEYRVERLLQAKEAGRRPSLCLHLPHP